MPSDTSIDCPLCNLYYGKEVMFPVESEEQYIHHHKHVTDDSDSDKPEHKMSEKSPAIYNIHYRPNAIEQIKNSRNGEYRVKTKILRPKSAGVISVERVPTPFSSDTSAMKRNLKENT